MTQKTILGKICDAKSGQGPLEAVTPTIRRFAQTVQKVMRVLEVVTDSEGRSPNHVPLSGNIGKRTSCPLLGRGDHCLQGASKDSEKVSRKGPGTGGGTLKSSTLANWNIVRRGYVGAWARDVGWTGLGAEDGYGRSDDDQVKYGPAIWERGKRLREEGGRVSLSERY
jgi:hypothetical protein